MTRLVHTFARAGSPTPARHFCRNSCAGAATRPPVPTTTRVTTTAPQTQTAATTILSATTATCRRKMMSP